MNRLEFLKQILAGFGGFWLAGNNVEAKPVERPEPVSLGIMPVAGYRYYDSKKIEIKIKPGDKTRLKREPENKFDRDAIAVFAMGYKIGYIPRRHNPMIAAMMDQKANINASIAYINQEEEAEGRIWVEVWIGERS